jgi:hypothetical protein
MTAAAFRKLALSMPGAVELPHFHRTSFRTGKKIFATMGQDGREAMIPVHPLARCLELLGSESEVFFSCGRWTERHGSLGVHLARADARQVAALVRGAYMRLAPKAKKR